MKIALNKSVNAHQMALYNEGKEEAGTAVKIGGNISGDQYKDIVNKLHRVALQRSHAKLKYRFVHMKVAVSPQDSDLSQRTFRKIAERVIDEMGYKNTPYLIYRHNDTEHPHVHIVLSRVTFDGKLISDKMDGLLARKVEREIETEFGLTKNRDRLINQGGIRNPGFTERYTLGEEAAIRKDLEKKGLSSEEVERRVGELQRKENTHRRYVINAFMESIADRPTAKVFLARMERRGVEVWRHEFEKGGKKSYGMTYKVRPDLMKASYASTDFTGQFCGMNLEESEQMVNGVSKLSGKLAHPVYGNIEGKYQIGTHGKPEMCLFNSKPIEHFQPMSFRASNLGPLMKYDSVLKQLSIAHEGSFASITVKRGGKKKAAVSYERKPLTENESASVAAILVAAECRSKERVREILTNGFQVEQLQSSAGYYDPLDYQFIMKEKQEMDKRKVRELVLVNKQPASLLNEYIRIKGERPNEPTREILKLLEKKDWGGVQLKLNQAIDRGNSKEEEVPDPALSRLSVIPSQLQVPFFDYASWLEREREFGTIDEKARKERLEREELSRNLLLSLQKEEYQASERLIKDHPVFISSLPRQVINEVKDEQLKEKLLLRYARDYNERLLVLGLTEKRSKELPLPD